MHLTHFLLLSLLLFVIYICLSFVNKWKRLNHLYNQMPLDIKTFDGLNSPYHPSVVYKQDGWYGYKYWMVETPFSARCLPYRDRNECPSIHVSHNGIEWENITKLTNPIDDLDIDGVENFDFFSDPHLFFRGNVLECWYRLTKRHGNIKDTSDCYLIRKTSEDGINWSEREVLVQLKSIQGASLNHMVVSPAIIYRDGEYHMWFVDSESRVQRNLAYSHSIDGRVWSNRVICNFVGSDSMPWHIDVQLIDGIFYLVNYDFSTVSIWKSSNGINFEFIRTLLAPSVPGSFYSNALYRSCIVKTDNEFFVYFSSNNVFRTFIGLMKGETIESLDVYNTPRMKFSTKADMLKMIYLLTCRKINFIIKWNIKKFCNRLIHEHPKLTSCIC